MVGQEGEESLVFASPSALKMVHKNDTVASDQTYKITPKLLGRYQVMIFALLAFGHALSNRSSFLSLILEYLVPDKCCQSTLESKFSEFKEGRKTPTAQQMLGGIKTTCVRGIVKPTSSGTNYRIRVLNTKPVRTNVPEVAYELQELAPYLPGHPHALINQRRQRHRSHRKGWVRWASCPWWSPPPFRPLGTGTVAQGVSCS
ncbi:uncharacterized protein LOC113215247 isoform X2 [Frankliniella occidentalis]|uniref:Uncharacterized protein LOC113215247 isoform X2 n=1 Tax=Frankliniella occidentalis TaxID=133901 RepID=A0A9C6X4W5_FRAOC|nr:uncharacterized protein LOC113215247 isoform X2 [Frankliniella occidentalis]XP_052129183.1 uncharacterized protein LOC113215247 isoform X2 [Frankliniella occidentalis]XP_052129185.1 uncharacterized protein LOC113215247 isoform X2 [Frankliniella occidentalis]